MPIHPDDKARYPANWRELRAAILARADGRCECCGECGLHSGRRCREQNHTAAQFAHGRIVLTIAHLDHTPEHNDPDNLRALCQRCHNRYDVQDRQRNRRNRRVRKMKILSLFEDDSTP